MTNELKLITRTKYMQDSANLHNTYYLQFATPSSWEFIKSNIGIEKLLTSEDKYFNDLYKHSNCGSGGWIWDNTPINMTLIRELGENNSMSTHTCVGKAVARELLREYKEKNKIKDKQVFRNKKYIVRNYDCTNIVACVADSAPNKNYLPCEPNIIDKLTKLYTENGVTYYGYL